MSRRFDGRPESEADRRFFDERDSGYTGPLDQDGHRVLHGTEYEILQHLAEVSAGQQDQR